MSRTKPKTDDVLWGSIDDAGSLGGVGVAESIAARIERLIFSEDLADGSRLPSERDLASMFSTSRPTVSQAIRILVVKGLVESRRGSGAYVARSPHMSLATSVDLMVNMNRESIPQLNAFRFWLETTGIVEAIKHGSTEEFDAGGEALKRLRSQGGDVAAWMSADTLFHATLVRASHNPYLASVYESVHAAVVQYEYRSWIDNGTVPAWLRHSEADSLADLHEPILAAVYARDEKAGKLAVLRHHEAMAHHLDLSHG